jgi:ABC-2 type transport system permease protein
LTDGRVTRLVAGREISERLSSRGLRVVTLVMALAVVAGVVLPGLIHSSSKTSRIGLVGASAQRFASALQATARAAKLKVRVEDVPSLATARADVKGGSLDLALVVGPSGARAIVSKTLSASDRALLASALDAEHQRAVLSAAGVPPATVRAARTPVPLSTVAIKPPTKNETAHNVAALAVAFFLYLTVVMYGNAVATGVAQEKTSRTAEVLLSAMRPGDLLAGKVIGIGVCGLVQLAIPVAAGLVANAVVHSAKIPSDIWFLLPASLVWFALGYALYALTFAAAGAIVARQEELQFATAPLTFPLLAGYLLTYALIASPHSTVLRILSYLPPLSPSLMPARIALGGLAWWEMPLAVALMLVTIYAAARLTARIYTGAIVRSGPRLSWGAALRLRPE